MIMSVLQQLKLCNSVACTVLQVHWSQDVIDHRRLSKLAMVEIIQSL